MGAMNDEKYKSSAVSAFNRYMAEKKMRRTPERYAILEKILQINKHFYVETLHEEMEKDGYHVSRATVYNTMQHLTEAGIVRRHQFANQPAQYEKIIDTATGNHQHLVCLKCGKVKELKDNSLVKSLTERRYQGFTPEYFAFYIYGICSQCRRRLKKSI